MLRGSLPISLAWVMAQNGQADLLQSIDGATGEQRKPSEEHFSASTPRIKAQSVICAFVALSGRSGRAGAGQAPRTADRVGLAGTPW